jgi:hypothetical protein
MKLVIYRDNTVTFFIQVLHIDGTPCNLTGCQILMCFKSDQSQPNTTALITKGNTSPYSGITITDVNHGMFQCTLTTADTQAIPDTIEVFTDILIIDSAANPFTVANVTTVEIKANITRR